MTTNPTFPDRLKELGANLDRWRTETDRLRQLAEEAVAAQRVEEGMLVDVERSAGLLYEEITAFNTLTAEIADTSPVAAAELATVDDALRLLLLEITELGTRLYSVRSTMPPAGITAGEAGG